MKNCVNCAGILNPEKSKCEYCGTNYSHISIKTKPRTSNEKSKPKAKEWKDLKFKEKVVMVLMYVAAGFVMMVVISHIKPRNRK